MSTLTLQQVQPLFSSPLALHTLDGAAVLNAALLAEITERRKVSPGLSRSNVHGWHSEDDMFEREEPGHRALCGHILEAVQATTRAVSPTFDFAAWGVQAEGWVNVLGDGGLNTPHDHPGWVWSGTYYVHVPEGDHERSGSIEFFDTRTNIRTLTVEGAACFASKHAVKPQAGMLIVFPSYLRHWVYPNESEEPRVTIAFNARFARIPTP